MWSLKLNFQMHIFVDICIRDEGGKKVQRREEYIAERKQIYALIVVQDPLASLTHTHSRFPTCVNHSYNATCINVYIYIYIRISINVGGECCWPNIA